MKAIWKGVMEMNNNMTTKNDIKIAEITFFMVFGVLNIIYGSFITAYPPQTAIGLISIITGFIVYLRGNHTEKQK